MLNFLSNRFCLSVIMFLSLLIFVLGCQDAKEIVLPSEIRATP